MQFYSKFGLVFLSMLFIWMISGFHFETPIFIFLFTTLHFFHLKLIVDFKWQKNFYGQHLPIGSLVLFFLYLQNQNYISVLSANNASQPLTAAMFIGFAFYFLQLLSLIISVLKGDIPLPSYLDFLITIIYFPKFLSGPVEPISFVKKVKNYHFKFADSALNEGLTPILTGIIFKFLIAGHLQRLVQLNESNSPLRILRSTIAFEMQVYFDFCGYSLIAYGFGIILGLPILLNFDHPFSADNVPEFWRRWHISLGKWFHTFIYEPYKFLYPNPIWRKLFLPLIVFLCSALWHGPTFNFLIWGIFHGFSFVAFIWLSSAMRIPSYLSKIHLFVTLIIGRFFFMDPDFDRMVTKIKILLSRSHWKVDLYSLQQIFAENIELLTKQGCLAVALGIGLIGYEIFCHKKTKTESSYNFLKNDFVFALGFAAFLFLFPLLPHFGFVYGR